MNTELKVFVHMVEYNSATLSDQCSSFSLTVGYTVTADVFVGSEKMSGRFDFDTNSVVEVNGLFDPEATVRKFVTDIAKAASGGA